MTRDVGQGRAVRSAVAVVPLRDGRSGKTRLSASLTAADRGALVVTLARHVVSTLVATPGVVQVLVVTEDPASARDALHDLDGPVRVLRQPPERPGLNAAVDAGRTQALEDGAAERLLVVHADLPALEPDDVVALLAAAAQPPRPPSTRAVAPGVPASPGGGSGPGVVGIALATDRAGTGTNAVVLDPVDPGFVFRFGSGSLQQHLAEAARGGRVPTVVRRTGTACDLDTEADWRALPDPVRHRVIRAVPAMARLTLAG